MPFVTETIWQNLPGMPTGERALIISRWPRLNGWRDHIAEEDFGRLQEIIRAVRNARSEYAVEPGRRIAAHVSAGEHTPLLQANAALMAALARLQPGMSIAPDISPPDKAITLAVGGVTVYLPLADLVDVAAERARLAKEIQTLENLIQRGENLLANPGFTAKAPAGVVERERAKLAEIHEKRTQLASRLAEL